MARELALHYLPMIGERYTPQVYLEKANYMEAVFFAALQREHVPAASAG
ncbi:hypothetical protein [Serratia ureilytica]|nr:hypothetical protein [Serratia ureilytica]MBU5412411.1 hypothetical protein [Serratia ureilytica]